MYVCAQIEDPLRQEALLKQNSILDYVQHNIVVNKNNCSLLPGVPTSSI